MTGTCDTFGLSAALIGGADERTAPAKLYPQMPIGGADLGRDCRLLMAFGILRLISREQLRAVALRRPGSYGRSPASRSGARASAQPSRTSFPRITEKPWPITKPDVSIRQIVRQRNRGALENCATKEDLTPWESTS
jgi:hypothetical protein